MTGIPAEVDTQAVAGTVVAVARTVIRLVVDLKVELEL